MQTVLLSFLAGILTILLLVLIRGRVLERRWLAKRKAELERQNEKFLNRGERNRRRRQGKQ